MASVSVKILVSSYSAQVEMVLVTHKARQRDGKKKDHNFLTTNITAKRIVLEVY